MAGYVIVDNKVTDEALYEEFRTQVAETVAAHGGRYLVRSASAEAIDGDWEPGRMVVVEFESVAAAKAWLASPDYAAAKANRIKSATASVIVVQGV